MYHGIANNNGSVGGGKGIYDASEGSKTTTYAVRIQETRQRLRRRDGRPQELATMTKASAEEDDPEELKTTMEASAEEA